MKAYYDYSDKPYIKDDLTEISSGEFAADTIVRFHKTLNVLRYSYDVKRTDEAIFNIDVKVATKDVPEKDDLERLTKDIEKVLKER